MMPDESSFEPGQHHSPSGGKPHGEERTLRSEKLQIERKTFLLALKENPRGQFVRITEDVGGRRDTIIIPTTGLEDFLKALQAMAEQIESVSAMPGSARILETPGM